MITFFEFRVENENLSVKVKSMDLSLVSKFLIFLIVFEPPQIKRPSHKEEIFFVNSGLSSYLTIEILSFIFLFFNITRIKEHIISICLKFLDGTFTIFEFPESNPNTRE